LSKPILKNETGIQVFLKNLQLQYNTVIKEIQTDQPTNVLKGPRLINLENQYGKMKVMLG